MRLDRLVSVLFFVVGAVALMLAFDVDAQRVSPDNPASATSETLSPLVETDGWCVATNGTTSVDVDAAAPARITAAEKSRARWIALKFIAGATSTRACHLVGGALPATSCNALDTDTVGVLTDGQTATYAIARDRVNGGLPNVDLQANAGSDGSLCVTIGW